MVFLQSLGQYDIPLFMALNKLPQWIFLWLWLHGKSEQPPACKSKFSFHMKVMNLIFLLRLIPSSNFYQLMLLWCSLILKFKEVCLPEKVVNSTTNRGGYSKLSRPSLMNTASLQDHQIVGSALPLHFKLESFLLFFLLHLDFFDQQLGKETLI